MHTSRQRVGATGVTYERRNEIAQGAEGCAKRLQDQDGLRKARSANSADLARRLDAAVLRALMAKKERDDLRHRAEKWSAELQAQALLDRAVEVERDELRAQLAAIPAGWKLVPVEPTPKMLDSVISESDRMMLGGDVTDEEIRTVWMEMINAAPEHKA